MQEVVVEELRIVQQDQVELVEMEVVVLEDLL
jgi:hypothetical protein